MTESSSVECHFSSVKWHLISKKWHFTIVKCHSVNDNYDNLDNLSVSAGRARAPAFQHIHARVRDGT